MPDTSQTESQETTDQENASQGSSQENTSQGSSVPSLFSEAEETGTLEATEVWAIKDIGQSAGFMTDYHVISHPKGIYNVDVPTGSVAQDLFDEAKNGADPETAIPGNPQPLRCQPSGKLVTPESGRYVGQLLDYNQSPLDLTLENPGNILLIQEQSNGWSLTSSSGNAHGANIKGLFEEARAAGDTQALKAIIEYLWFAYRDDITIREGGQDFQAHSDRTRALRRMLLKGSASDEEEEESTPQTSLAGLER
jgi:hypothetical protein